MKIILDYDEFKEFIENITDEYRQTYRGDWDWVRLTSFEVKEDHVLQKDRYHDNGIKCPDDTDTKILFFKLRSEE